MKFVTAIVLLAMAGIGTPAPLEAFDEDIRVIETDDRGLTVEITAPALKVESMGGEGRQGDADYRRVRVQGWARSDRAGSPDLPSKSFLVQVPGTGKFEARVLENREERLQVGRVAPVPRQTLLQDGSIGETYQEDERIYGSAGLFPSALVSVGERTLCRGVSLARITVHPFRWSPATGEIWVSTQLRLRLEFEEPLAHGLSEAGSAAVRSPRAAAGNLSGEGAFQRLLQSMVLGYRGPGALAPGGADAAVSTGASVACFGQDAEPFQFLRIEVREEGVYRLSYDDLASAGFFARNADPRSFRLHNLGQEMAMQVISPSAGGRFGPGDSLEFYGQGVDTPFTDTNVYYLSAQRGDGKRVSQIDGLLTGMGTPVGSFRETIRVEENHTFWEGVPGAPEADAWFWERMTAPAGGNHTLVLPSPVADSEGAWVRVAFQGRSTAAPSPNHRTTVELNGTRIGEALWDGAVAHVQDALVPAGLVRDGANTLRIGLPGDTGAPVDIVYFNRVEVEYTRALEAVDDRLRFSLAGTGRRKVSVGNLTGPDVRIYDVTDAWDVREVVNPTVEQDGEVYRAVFEVELDGTRSYLVQTHSRMAAPPGLSCRINPFLRNPKNAADYLLITPQEFVPVTLPLAWLRWTQGLRVRVVSVEDIYDTFSHGLADPRAIRDFLRCAYETWAPPVPAYVLLLGDANTDYRDFTATGKKSRVPVHLSVTSGLGLTPDDNWYACVDGDDVLPDLFLGRLPAASRQAAAEAVWKSFLYEALPPSFPAGALFAADDDSTAFETLNEGLVASLPQGFVLDRVYLRLYDQVARATEDILASLNQGRLMVTYTGHGAVTNWAGELLFQSSDVSRLAFTRPLPFVVTLNCLNGYFSHFSHYCLAEAFVAAPFKGAVACFSPSGLGYTWEHQILAQNLYSEIFEQGNPVLGQVTTRAKVAAHGQGVTEDLVRTFTLLGDPALRLKSWE